MEYMNIIYFMIFSLNAGLYSYLSFKSVKKDIDLFREIHAENLNKKCIENKIASLPYKLLIENTIICVYIADTLDNFLYKIIILRIIFGLSGLFVDRLDVNKRVIREKFIHHIVLSFMIIPNRPTYSYLLQLMDSFMVILFDKYFHDYYREKKAIIRNDEFISRLDKFINEEKLD